MTTAVTDLSMQKYVPVPLAYCSENFLITCAMKGGITAQAQRRVHTRGNQRTMMMCLCRVLQTM